MLIAAKFLGATCLAGALATSGVLTTDHLSAHHDRAAITALVPDPHAGTQAEVDVPTTTTTEAPTTTTTEAPTTSTTAAPTLVTSPAPVQPTVIPVAGAGTVVIVVQGPVIVVRDVKALPGWIASIERRSGEVNVLFHKGDRTFRFFASMVDRRLTSAIREVRADGDHPFTFGDRRDGDRRDGDGHWDGHWDGRH